MNKNKYHRIKSIDAGSIAEELELAPGDQVVSINGQALNDRLDYEFYMHEAYLEVEILTNDNEEIVLEIEKDPAEDLGINFEHEMLSAYQSCCNRCVFCFIDQMPPGMRESLYFKDDDARLSFLQGNYITLTNMKDADIERIIQYRLSPINISVHTTNPKLREKMLHNRFAGEALKKLDRLYEGKIEMNGQIVLCKGLNDGDELERSIADLTEYLPYMQSVSVVPVGLSKYRDGLYPLEPFTKEEAAAVIDRIESWQQKIYAVHGIHFIHASDEFYLLAERTLPTQERYDGYVQLENGVGMLRLLMDEVDECLAGYTGDERKHELSIATGKLAYPLIQSISARISAMYPYVTVHVYAIANHFFGEQITVSGLITGTDILEQLKGKELGSTLLLPVNMFRSGEAVFLDDVTAAELESALQVPIDIVKSSGKDLVDALLRNTESNDIPDHSPYELSE